jgi:uncharacterized iron-regulated membrane protein
MSLLQYAGLQAEFNEKKWVWVPDAKEGYLAGWVNEEEEDAAQVIMATGGEVNSSIYIYIYARLMILLAS